MTDAALLGMVRRLARRTRPVPDVSATVDADWKEAEQALSVEVARSFRAGARLVAAFEALAEAAGSYYARGRAARLRGSFLSLHGRHEAALASYDLARSLLRGAARDGARVGQAGALLRLRRFEAATELLRKASRSAQRRGDGVLAAAAALNLGVVHTEAGKPRAALAPLESAVAGFRAAGDDAHAGFACANLANALVLLERWEDAQARFGDASDHLAQAGAAGEASRCLYNEGVLLHATGRLGDALVALDRAGGELDAAGLKDVAALAAVDRAAVLLEAGLHEDALDLLRTARRRLGPRTAPGEHARSRILHAAALLASGRAGAAGRLLRGDLAPLEAEAAELRGRIAAARGRLDDAVADLDRAARGFRRNRPSAAARCLALAACCALPGSTPTARRLSRRAVAAADATKLPGARFAAHAAHFLVERAAGRPAAADASLRIALDALDATRARRGASVLTESLLVGREAWFTSAVAHTLEHDGPRAAHALAERWRSRALADLLAGSAREPRAVAALRAELAAIEARLGAGLAPALLRGAAADAGRLVRELRRSERALASALSSRVPVREAAARHAVLPDGVVVLSLVAGESATWAFDVAHPDRVERVGLGNRDVRRALAELRTHFGSLAFGEAFVGRHRGRIERSIRRLLEGLGNAVLRPFRARLSGARRVIVVPDGAWFGVPFGALSFEGAPLAASVVVAQAPSVAFLGDVPHARGAPVVVGVRDERAPGMVEEARGVAKVLGPRTRLFEGDAATFDALRRRRRPTCLHVAAHGRFRPDAPSMSAMRLADGWLRAVEWQGLDLDGSTVVLSGCDTGVSAARGRELAGLVRGVLAAGAGDVVTGLFPVGDRATQRFMLRFHRALAASRDAAEALAAAQRGAARARRPVWEWCGFASWTRRLPV